MKIRSTFEMEIDVDFKDPEKAKAYFIESEDWKNAFYSLEDLKELAAHLALNFHIQIEGWSAQKLTSSKFVEGFGEFVAFNDGTWRLTDEWTGDSGEIFIEYESNLEDTYSQTEK
ncbi:hypothetical protein WAX88_16220 [Photobacterium damselae subsp. damselae]|uniref:hypothetical protein n=1 Tax=Photobacterium damselae TaxID=38293 RepID=UPI00311B21E9